MYVQFYICVRISQLAQTSTTPSAKKNLLTFSSLRLASLTSLRQGIFPVDTQQTWINALLLTDPLLAYFCDPLLEYTYILSILLLSFYWCWYSLILFEKTSQSHQYTHNRVASNIRKIADLTMLINSTVHALSMLMYAQSSSFLLIVLLFQYCTAVQISIPCTL